jgi:hypothetical protein
MPKIFVFLVKLNPASHRVSIRDIDAQYIPTGMNPKQINALRNMAPQNAFGGPIFF